MDIAHLLGRDEGNSVEKIILPIPQSPGSSEGDREMTKGVCNTSEGEKENTKRECETSEGVSREKESDRYKTSFTPMNRNNTPLAWYIKKSQIGLRWLS